MPVDTAASRGWEVSSPKDAAFEHWATRHDLLFASTEWAYVLAGLDCEVVFAWQREIQFGIVVPIFRRGPLRVGFMGFPIAGERLSHLPVGDFEELQRTLAETLGCHLIRGVRSQVPMAGPGALPEVWVEDLRAWPGRRGKRIDKDLAFAARAGIGKRLVAPFVDGRAVYELYERTVLGHRGRLRYTPEYFHRLTELGARSRLLQAVAMVDANGTATAFAVMARHGEVAYYLHGAVHPDARSTGDGDLLLAHLIGLAKNQNARSFSLMASPANQPGLVRYKKKWGETEGYTCTHDVGRGWLGRSAELIVRGAASWVNRREGSV